MACLLHGQDPVCLFSAAECPLVELLGVVSPQRRNPEQIHAGQGYLEGRRAEAGQELELPESSIQPSL